MSVVPLAGLLGAGSLASLVDGALRSNAEARDACLERGAAFVNGAAVASLASEAEARGLLPVVVQPLGPADRGKLALVLEEAVEGALERRGACPPGVGAATDLETSLGDQLYRARLIEARGLCVFVASLEGITTLSGALDAEDSAVLRWWLDASRTLAVRLLLDASNRSLGVYGPPRPLASWVEAAATVDAPRESAVVPNVASPAVAPDIAASSETMEWSEQPPAVAAAPEAEFTGSESTAPSVEITASSVEASASFVETAPSPVEPSPVDAVTPVETPPLPAVPELREGEPTVVVALDAVLHEQATATASKGPLHPGASAEWQTWVRELEMARGPKPLAAVERMFVMSYVPLRDAVLRGIAPSSAADVLEGWATSFASSYREAFEAMRVRGKRPTMVLDVPDAAMRIGRLHGARSVQLLLVDGMRFDLGLRVELGLRARLGREVALTERLLLWSALPATTETQLELIGRGPEGLKDLSAKTPDSEIPVARGRMARTPRRIKAGHRELLKLDLVEARLGEPGAAEAGRLDALGAEITDAVAELCEKLPPRTLLFVFGDHGFCLDAQSEGTSALRQGGARPEEVLVPAFAWLVGGVQ